MAVNLYRTAVRSYRSGILLRSLSSQTPNKGTIDNPHVLDKNYEKPKIANYTLDQEVPELPKAIYVQRPELEAKTKVTTLSNGLRVASEPRFGQFCTVGKYYLMTFYLYILGLYLCIPSINCSIIDKALSIHYVSIIFNLFDPPLCQQKLTFFNPTTQSFC